MIIDFHTHIFPPFIRNSRGTFFHDEPDFKTLYDSPESRLTGRKELLENMVEEGIDRSVIFGFPWRTVDYFKRHNDYIIDSVQKYPDRLTGFCCFDPTSRKAPEEAERCLKAGLTGIGELAVYDRGFSIDIIEALDDIMMICLQYETPVLIHTNEPVGHQYPGKQPMTLRQLYDLIKRYPSNKIVLAHWGGGLFFYRLMKKEVNEIMGNVWFDTAASPFLYSPDIYRVAGEIMGFDRILLGSDYPLIKPGRYFKEIKSAGLSPVAVKKISGLNAANLLQV
jgi:predicted TIM-barrel fold metal-dependent hydrolase